MNKTKHCTLCEHQIRDQRTGTFCGLTEQKPSFNSICKEIKFGDKLEGKIIQTEVDFSVVNKQKLKVYAQVIVALIVGFFFIISGLFFGIFIADYNVISTVPVILIGIGLFVTPFAFKIFIPYKQSLSIAKTKLAELKTLLSEYQISYDLNLNMEEDIHHRLEFDPELFIRRKQ